MLRTQAKANLRAVTNICSVRQFGKREAHVTIGPLIKRKEQVTGTNSTPKTIGHCPEEHAIGADHVFNY